MKIDLHMHSTFSDGKLTPTELVHLLHNQDVRIAALSDHDSTNGLPEAIAAAAAYSDLRIVPAVEISADHPSTGNGDVHVLGYFLDFENAALGETLASFRDNRTYRGREMVKKLIAAGYLIEWDRVVAIAGEAGIGRPHIAQALVEKGYVRSVKDAFNGILDDDGIAFVDRPHISMIDAAKLISSAGGVTVLAHPLFIPDYEKLLPHLHDMGFVGFEVHYGEFDIEQREKLVKLADQYQMLPCGGSDYHAMGHAGECLPGSAGPPQHVFEALEDLAVAGRST